MKSIVAAIFTLTLVVFLTVACNPFGESERIKAIGSTARLSAILQRAYNRGNDFLPLELPIPGDWLAEHQEPGQTYKKFAATRYNRPDNTRNKIYLQPLETFHKDGSPSLETLRAYVRAVFAIDVKVLNPIPLKDEFTPRINRLTRAIILPYTVLIKTSIFARDGMQHDTA